MQYVNVLINIPASNMDRRFVYRVPDHLKQQDLFGKRVLVSLGSRTVEGYVTGGGEAAGDEVIKPVLQVLDREAVVDQRLLKLAEWVADHYLCPVSTALGAILPAPLHHKAGQVVIPLIEPDVLPKPELHPAALQLLENLWEFGQLGYRQVLNLVSDEEMAALLEQKVILLSSNYQMAGQTQSEGYYIPGKLPENEQLLMLKKRAPRQAAALELVQQAGSIPIGDLEKHIPKKSLQILQARGYLKTVGMPASIMKGHLPATREQTAVLAPIQDAIIHADPRTWVLHGITASGKTEVYLRAIDTALAVGRQAIVMVPEIALTTHLEQVYRSRIKQLVVLHSRMAGRERHRSWMQIKNGEADVVLGTRSAVFAPVPNLGLIVIDEEHETSYKQDETPRYHAREVASARSVMEKAPLILGSATPAVESYYRAENGDWHLLKMKQRVGDAALPCFTIVDMRKRQEEGGAGIISPFLAERLETLVADGRQGILFINRRGYSPFTQCMACGQVLKCPRCSVSLTYHQDSDRNICHYCDYQSRPPVRCPGCGSMHLRNTGYGTQKVQEDVQKLLPHARVERLDLDSSRQKGRQNAILKAMARHEIDILVGTQMVAKGLDYPGVALVGIVDADITLHLPDFRAAERTFQLIVQAAGRAGRSRWPGEVVVQTFNPAHPVIELGARQDYNGFYEQEIEMRRLLGYPPFTDLVRIVVWDVSQVRGREIAQDIFSWIYEIIDAKEEQVAVLGPAPCPLSKLRGKYRFQIIVKSDNPLLLNSIGKTLLPQKYKGVHRIEIDINPVSMM